MLIYNVTFHIENGIHEEAVVFLKNEYIRNAVQNGILFNPRFCRIYRTYEEEGHSYSIQFYVKSQALLNEWQSITGSELQKQLEQRFQQKILGFVTLLEELDC